MQRSGSGPVWERVGSGVALGAGWENLEAVGRGSGVALGTVCERTGPVKKRSGSGLGPVWERSRNGLGAVWERSGSGLGAVWRMGAVWDRSGLGSGVGAEKVRKMDALRATSTGIFAQLCRQLRFLDDGLVGWWIFPRSLRREGACLVSCLLSPVFCL